MLLRKTIKRLIRDIDYWWFYKNFYNNFKYYSTEDEKELKELYKLRYHVYCKEYHYIDLKDTHEGLEYDDWDVNSVHFIIRDQKNEIAATVRLVKYSELGFPIEKNFKYSIDTSKLDKNKIIEISRLIVTREYRRQHLLFLLIKGIYLFVKQNKLENVFCVVDERLYNLLIKIGIPIIKIGPPAMYQGYTYPCLLNVNEFEQELKVNNSKLFRYLLEGIISYDSKNNKYTLSG